MLPTPIRKFLKATSFWQENSFLFREFKNFRRIAVLAVIFTSLAAVFEGFGVGFILTFLQGFTNRDCDRSSIIDDCWSR